MSRSKNASTQIDECLIAAIKTIIEENLIITTSTKMLQY